MVLLVEVLVIVSAVWSVSTVYQSIVFLVLSGLGIVQCVVGAFVSMAFECMKRKLGKEVGECFN